MQWIKQYGDDFWAKDFNQFRTEVTDDDSIGCATCHNAETMQLQLYSEPLKDYLKSVGKDPAKLPRSEMRSLVCAQSRPRPHQAPCLPVEERLHARSHLQRV